MSDIFFKSAAKMSEEKKKKIALKKHEKKKKKMRTALQGAAIGGIGSIYGLGHEQAAREALFNNKRINRLQEQITGFTGAEGLLERAKINTILKTMQDRKELDPSILKNDILKSSINQEYNDMIKEKKHLKQPIKIRPTNSLPGALAGALVGHTLG